MNENYQISKGEYYGIEECENLLASLRLLRTNNKIKMLEGSFDDDTSGIIELLFKEADSGEKWLLEGKSGDQFYLRITRK